MHDFTRDYRFSEAAQKTDLLEPESRATFEGFRRANGKVGTRNFIGILTSVNCSASVARFMAEAVERSGLLEDYPMIDGVIPLLHGGGCALAVKGEPHHILNPTQWAHPPHPIIAA